LFGSARICSKHFSDACFTKPLQQELLGYSPSKARKLRPDAIPTLHLRAVSPLISNKCLSIVETFDEVMAPPALNEVLMNETPAPSTSTEAIMSSKM